MRMNQRRSWLKQQFKVLRRFNFHDSLLIIFPPNPFYLVFFRLFSVVFLSFFFISLSLSLFHSFVIYLHFSISIIECFICHKLMPHSVGCYYTRVSTLVTLLHEYWLKKQQSFLSSSSSSASYWSSSCSSSSVSLIYVNFQKTSILFPNIISCRFQSIDSRHFNQ